jgi:hypothetical protein
MASTQVESTRRKRQRGDVTNEEFVAGVRRMLNALPARAETSGIEVLAAVHMLEKTLNLVRDQVVDICRREPWSESWSRIGSTCDMTTQAAHQRWGSLGGTRRPGGQPSNLR